MPACGPAAAQALGLYVKNVDDIFGKIPRNRFQLCFWKEHRRLKTRDWKETFLYEGFKLFLNKWNEKKCCVFFCLFWFFGSKYFFKVHP